MLKNANTKFRWMAGLYYCWYYKSRMPLLYCSNRNSQGIRYSGSCRISTHSIHHFSFSSASGFCCGTSFFLHCFIACWYHYHCDICYGFHGYSSCHALSRLHYHQYHYNHPDRVHSVGSHARHDIMTFLSVLQKSPCMFLQKPVFL